MITRRRNRSATLACVAVALSSVAAGATTYSPYANEDYPTQVYFGDTHHHSANSGDAFMNGDRLGPEKSYRFARGEQVVSSTGIPVRLRRPLDFLVIADHAEGLGVVYELYNGNPAMMADETLARWSRMMRAGGKQAAAAATELISAQALGKLPTMVTDPRVNASITKTVWEEYTATAEKFNEPGRFTAMIGYEWTSVPGGNNLHRNVLFRDGKARADQAKPFTSWQSSNPEDLWRWMADYEQRTGGQVLAIPHNANLSNGKMFALVDFEDEPLDRDYAERRARWEPLVEVMQTKGNSETHPSMSPNDEFADFGVNGWDNGNLTLTGEKETPQMRPHSYLRGGLMLGLAQEQAVGVNPFKFGMIGGTDVHTSLSAIDEENFFGKKVIQEPRPERWKHITKIGLGEKRYTWQHEAAGYAAVWARENTREALWDAMQRKEVYATSGSRIVLRFFGGWQFEADDAASRYVARVGYGKGVPMGADLPSRPAENGAPTFLVAAMKDPLGANLDRLQVIKGWVDADGNTHEKIYDVAWGDAATRPRDEQGRIPPVGDTVDVADASWRNTIGDPDLAAVWQDPDFDPDVSAFYYLRAIEIPTPRWTAYDQKRFGVVMDDSVPMKHQERAWSSPIWYTPDSTP